MFKWMNSLEFISTIKEIDQCLNNLKISAIRVNRSKKEICYEFICDKVVSQEIKQKILQKAESITPPVFQSVKVAVKKIVSSPDLLNSEIFKFINDNYPSLSIFLKTTDVVSYNVGNIVKYTVRLTKDGVEHAQKCGLIKKINDFLSIRFCSDFAGNLEEKENTESFSLLNEEVYESQISRIEHRTIKVTNVIVVDDPTMDNLALYIEDAVDGEVTVCGKVIDIVERETKNGKPYFIIHLDDTTGKTSGVYFSKKNTLSKIREIKIGDAIIARGSIGEYNGKRSFTLDKINLCTFPSDFVKKDRFKKVAPNEYKLIFPEPVSTVSAVSVFDADLPLPEQLTNNVYVVFDLETTGVDVINNGITQIGAVKIENGKLKEKFETLVKPDYPITEEITKLTGITEEMVKDAPKISAVLPDFMRFIKDAILVAHNAEFDVKFIKKFATAEEYEINNQVIDTLSLSRSLIKGLKHYDLHTLADKFGIVFTHHRAMSDALATAQLFIELMKIKNK